MTLRRAILSLPAADEAHNGPLSLRIAAIRRGLCRYSVAQVHAPNANRLATDVTDAEDVRTIRYSNRAL
jgi:hypothetical protein